MELIPYRMLRNEPSEFRKTLADEGEWGEPVEGKPFAVMIDQTDYESMEDILLIVPRLHTQMAVREIRKRGLNKLCEVEIENQVLKSRTERQPGNGS